ncbi:MAG: hypothetical protein MJZ32_06370 [Bacteroidaceae bacterium]|nr:hypothetical protein [Bacteroidaceae bacterium]
MKKILFSLFLSLAFSSSAMAQKSNDAWVKQIRKSYAEALKKIETGQQDANLNNKAVIVINQNFPGSGPSEFTVEYFFDTKDSEQFEGEQERQLYFMRVKERWAETPSVYEYLFNTENGDLMFYFAKTIDPETGKNHERRDYYNGIKAEPFLEIIDGKNYKTSVDDQWMFIKRFLMGYREVFNNLPPYFEH